jgi:hypothetical protein
MTNSNDKDEMLIAETSNTGGAREGAGRKRFTPTVAERRQVESMAGFGVPIESIAALVRDGISHETLRNRFAKELAQGKAKANAKVGQTLFQKAIAGDTSSLIWWTKTQMRWSETHRHEIDVQHTHVLHLDALKRMADRARVPHSGHIEAEAIDVVEHPSNMIGWSEPLSPAQQEIEDKVSAVLARSAADPDDPDDPPGSPDHPAAALVAPTPAHETSIWGEQETLDHPPPPVDSARQVRKKYMKDTRFRDGA